MHKAHDPRMLAKGDPGLNEPTTLQSQHRNTAFQHLATMLHKTSNKIKLGIKTA